MDEYRDGVVGAKSKNLAGLRGKLPADIALPASVTLPFGCFEQVGVRGSEVGAGRQ
jgi:alpha-glucan,water dikinase